MLKYLKKSFDKFSQDALSKAFYDIGKYFVAILIALFLTTLLPTGTTIGDIFRKEINISVGSGILIISSFVIITVFSTLFFTKRKYKILQKDNFTDELTGLLNHKALKEITPEIIESCKKQGQKLSLIMLDIDNFKTFNKQTSYQIADRVMEKVGLMLKSDSRATDTLFRQYFKGDEFIIFAKNTELANAQIAAARKKDLFNSAIEVDEHTYRLTVCCGVTEFNFEHDTQESALTRVNKALLMAKARPNKNSIEVVI